MLVFGLLFCALSVDQRSRGCGNNLFIWLGAFRMWLSSDVEVWEFYFEECSFGVSSGDEWLWILCLPCFVSVKVSVLGGDVFWWFYLQGFYLVVMVYRLYAAPFVSCSVHTLRLAG
uniref:Transmembrane protein n=1 Tax=Medicago truncatula TaxID=3880 RepID=Q1S5I5_MEDTR|nr:hypothetical protein MtrDRAFT_AC147431g6v2 [Medicago truncatula]